MPHCPETQSANSTPGARRLAGFRYRMVDTRDARISVATAGEGPPLLLLHGYPQNHLVWHQVAPALVQSFSVVCPDLRGYGDSSKPHGLDDHSNYSKRSMAQDMLEVMTALGFPQFFLAGHDRGARVAYRLALDHPSAVRRLAMLDVVSTKAIYEYPGCELPSRYFHWYFLIQAKPLPETLILGAPDAWVSALLPPGTEMLPEYVRTFARADSIHATCEDYRAAYCIDWAHDRADVDAGRKIDCPTLILWGGRGVIGTLFKPLETWRDLVSEPTGRALNCGHFIPEELPTETTESLRRFFTA